MELKRPKKGEGVPKETPARNSIAALQSILAQHFPGQPWQELKGELERRNFFAAGIHEQARLMAHVAVELSGAQRNGDAVMQALSESPVEKVRGVAAFAVPILFPDDLQKQLAWLAFISASEGAWPGELAAIVLRPLIIRHGVSTILPLVQQWIKHENPALRRLVAEAFRPRGATPAHLEELKENPLPLKTVLEPLLDDPAQEVQEAIASTLNDISMDNPEVVLAWTKEWNTPSANKQRHWILARALRTLIADGHPAALNLLGYGATTALKITWNDNTPRRLKLNQAVLFDLEVQNFDKAATGVAVLLLMDEPGKGRARRRSTHQIWKGRLKAGESRRISKKIHFAGKNSLPRVEGKCYLSMVVNAKMIETRELIFKR